MADTRIVIVGSGIAGATIASILRARNIGPILMLEAGPIVEMRSRRRWLDYVMNGAAPYDDCADTPDDVSGSENSRLWLSGSRLFARGGSTLHWGGWALRFQAEDFSLRAATDQGMDWPFGYDEIEPYYGQAESFLGVAGDSTQATPFRSSILPYPAVKFTRIDAEIIHGFERLGYGYAPMPIARNVAPRDGRPACQTTGTCKYCPLGARYTADQTLDRLETDPGFSLRLNAAVHRVVLRSRNRVAGIEYADTRTGQVTTVTADQVILCAGALETPKLLLNSACVDWPTGVGNASNHLGRHLLFHPLLFARGNRLSNPQRLQHELDFPTLCSRHFDSAAEQATGKMFMFLPPGNPTLNLGALMAGGIGPAAIRDLVAGPYSLELQAFMEIPSGPNNSVAIGSESTRLGLPSTRLFFENPDVSARPLRRNLERLAGVLAAAGYGSIEIGMYPPRGDHAAATCRMANSDGDGVVDAALRVHGLDNLYVCSNAVFPSGGAVNPTLTLTALAMRFASQFQ